MRAALLPIHPRYAEAIFSGEKKVEFRRKSFKHKVNNVVVYSCAPVMKVIGYFEIEEVEISDPQKAWARFGGIGCISENEFYSYYQGSEVAVSIRIRKAVRFNTPINICELDKSYIAPQSFRYLPANIFAKLLSGNVN